MKEFMFEVKDALGLHARPVAALAKKSMGFDSVICLAANGRKADGRNLMELMGLGVQQGDIITLTIEGADEEAAAGELQSYLEEHL